MASSPAAVAAATAYQQALMAAGYPPQRYTCAQTTHSGLVPTTAVTVSSAPVSQSTTATEYTNHRGSPNSPSAIGQRMGFSQPNQWADERDVVTADDTTKSTIAAAAATATTATASCDSNECSAKHHNLDALQPSANLDNLFSYIGE
ncbi:hypothetical protein T265_02220 [Opisthorchis viverrini]|uniref:Uncharacterized protein n=1 Tax=Opisthorchis viverrini TaxID=6198 RepID=A0A074ZZZ1_OPIVI|nr:hypothetical protein T265_02220 [Opisthorchis viverrini]KER31582.1 hypothetical protein T265_02220 [Opisthorchis viverrini]